MIYYENHLSLSNHHVTSSPKMVFQRYKSNIKPEIFNQSVGYYMNMRHAYEYKDDDEPPPDLDEKFPHPSLTGQSVELWSTPRSCQAYQTWMYQQNQRVYIE